MPPQSRGTSLPKGFHSKSTPNLPTLGSLSSDLSPVPNPPSAKTDAPSNPLSPTDTGTSPSEPASIEDNLSPEDPFALDASGASSASDDGDDDDEFGFDADYDPDDVVNGRSTSTGGASSSQPRRPLYSHASRSHSHLPHTSSALFPPFYNRPPTPLPPSPSLTSLLRPSFSAQTSRPTTPDSSDVEGIGGGGGGTTAASGRSSSRHPPPTTTATTATAAAAKRAPSATSGVSNGTGTPTNLTASFASATLVPRASPKVPTYEYYGFFIYLASSFAFLMYLLWAYLPRPFLHQLGIYYYPNRWWALAVPAWLVVLVVYIYVALASYNLGYLTLPMGNNENMVDDAAQIATLDASGKVVRKGKGKEGKEPKVAGRKGGGRHSRNGSLKDGKGGGGFAVERGMRVDWRNIWSESTDAVLDVPIGGVCEILYGDGRVAEDEDGDMDGRINGVL
ncbi:PIG-P domain-containing protein [Neofusicoccum parvum]|nr:PIG-P domain-containing protein [Neofusicoccum parvum]